MPSGKIGHLVPVDRPSFSSADQIVSREEREVLSRRMRSSRVHPPALLTSLVWVPLSPVLFDPRNMAYVERMISRHALKLIMFLAVLLGAGSGCLKGFAEAHQSDHERSAVLRGDVMDYRDGETYLVARTEARPPAGFQTEKVLGLPPSFVAKAGGCQVTIRRPTGRLAYDKPSAPLNQREWALHLAKDSHPWESARVRATLKDRTIMEVRVPSGDSAILAFIDTPFGRPAQLLVIPDAFAIDGCEGDQRGRAIRFAAEAAVDVAKSVRLQWLQPPEKQPDLG